MNSRILFLTGLLIFLSSFSLRYGYIMHTEVINPIRADAKQYLDYGFNLYKYGVYSKQEAGSGLPLTPDSYRSPGYPVLIAICFFIGGVEIFYPLLLFFQVFLSSLVPVMTLYLALRILPFLWSVLVCILVALSPHLVSMCGYMLTETLFSFLIVLSLLLFVEAYQQKKLILFALSAIFWGGAYFTNETALLIPFSLALILCFLIWKKGAAAKFKIRWLIVFTLIFSLFPVSWTVRNHLVIPHDAPQASSRALATITHGSYIDFVYESEQYKYFPYYEDPMQPAISNSFSTFIEVMQQRFSKKPLEYISWYLVKKPYYLWSWDILQGQGDIYVYPVKKSFYMKYKIFDTLRGFLKLVHPALMLFFLFGILQMALDIFCFKNINIIQKTTLAAIVCIPIYYTLLYTVFAPWPRYAVPLRPLFFLSSIYSIFQIYNFFKNRSSNLIRINKI